MKAVAIVLDKWKLDTFRRYLHGGGYTFTEVPGATPDTLILKVKTDDIARLGDVIRMASAECWAPAGHS
jgi:hypothetical protein